ncbi:single-stranded DNA-binding protein [Mycobacterium antarcticum]|uniref:single-stranded DNA-binding protein n=1 Tax=unclassified Mycolicibacterium TaxID=2636767 RepID=UPI002389E8BE|nr:MULTISPECIES: single-stranded DNA-binding protein [unclassified Mycolicibacterium]GLP74605.1 single-stranded DNA-binding protein [Mycolicibacterium sp. TUM20983]GLP80400.1 single-stranded DNA-binding protein [Mycolicibacterium sp. TUM20984]
MFETPFALVGTIVTDPIHRRVGDQQVVKFRVASNSRRRTAEGTWEAGNSLFVNVNCWGRLVGGVGGVLTKGDPIVVVGHLYTSEYDDKEGNRRSSVEVRATAVGPDLGRCNASIVQRRRVDTDTEAEAEAGSVGVDADTTSTGDEADEDGDLEDGGLPLTA